LLEKRDEVEKVYNGLPNAGRFRVLLDLLLPVWVLPRLHKHTSLLQIYPVIQENLRKIGFFLEKQGEDRRKISLFGIQQPKNEYRYIEFLERSQAEPNQAIKHPYLIHNLPTFLDHRLSLLNTVISNCL
jgi:hypothetical protein